MHKIQHEIQCDREYLHTRLMKMDDTSVIKNWVTQEIETVKEELIEEFRPKILNYGN